MTERYNVQASTILGENYNITNIECSDYNPSIDESITVTITLTDVYTDPITDENVTVTCTGGSFTQLNGTDIPSDDSVTGTTNSSGQFTLTYTCTDWGLITFSANNTSTQVNVTGWKQIATYASNKITLYSDGKWARVSVSGSFSNSSTGEQTLATISSDYAPVSNVSTNMSYSTNTYAPLYNKGTSICVNRSSTGNYNVYATLYFALESPRY